MTKDEALDRLEFYLEFRNDSLNTIKMYRFYLGKFFDTLPDNFDIASLTIDEAMTYVVQIKNSGRFAPQTINLIISDLRTFYEVVLDSPLSRRKFPRLKYTLEGPYIFSEDELTALLNASDIRTKVFITLGYDCGFRSCEVANLRVSDIDSSQMLIRIRETKRNKSRYVKLSQPCLNLLRKYWLVYRPTDYMFEGRNGHLSTTAIRDHFNQMLEKAGITDEKARFHSLRATYATILVKNNCDVFTLKQLMGHSSLESTQRYVSISHSSILKASSPSDFIGDLA